MLIDLGWSLLEAWDVGIKVLATITRKLERNHSPCELKSLIFKNALNLNDFILDRYLYQIL